ncbi:MAG: O-antigen ligase family protein [Acidobacteriota bacterium]
MQGRRPNLIASTAPLLPAGAVLVFAVELGTFYGAAGGVQALAGHCVLWIALAWTLPRLPRDAVGPGVLAWGAVAISVAFSPVPRTGVSALAVLPAFLAAPAAAAWAFGEGRARRRGVLALMAALALVAGGALVAWRVYGTPGASLPLGHHNLLASWLVGLLPVTLLGRRYGRVGLGLAAVAGALGLLALVATGSLAGFVGLASALVAWVFLESLAQPTSPSRRRVLALTALVAATAAAVASSSVRVQSVLAGGDLSVRARVGYVEAAWRGWLERPLPGWGAGSTRWTLAEHLEPTPGVHPPGEVVADAHLLPLQVFYELGAVGLTLLLAAAWWWLRQLPIRATLGRPEARAAALGLLALGVSSLGGLDLGVTALPVLAAVLLGLVASSAVPVEGAGPGRRRLGWPLGLGVTLLLIAWQTPRDVAHLAYDRARSADVAGDAAAALRHLETARRLDPGQALYAARLGWLGEGGAADAAATAEAARGVAALWRGAGEEARRPGDVDASTRAYRRACALDPLGAVAPFRLAVLAPHGPAAASVAGRALVAEPRLLAAVDWPPGLIEGAVRFVLDIDGIDPGWRVALDSAAASTAELRESPGFGSSPAKLGLRIDRVDSESVSLFAFRRRPWPALLATLELERGLLPEIDLPPASTLDLTDRRVFTDQCRLRSLARR